MQDRDTLRASLQELSTFGRKFDKAVDTALAHGVKEAHFLPSGRKILSVVGTLGDEFIDPEKPYCSCSNFFFKVRKGVDKTCYHLLSHQVAVRSNLMETIEFNDEEYGPYLKALVGDVLEVLNKSEGS